MQENLLDRVKSAVRRTGDRLTGRAVPTRRAALENVDDRTLSTPAVDVFENDAELLIMADVPGATPDNSRVQLDERGRLAMHVRIELSKEEQSLYGDEPPADWYRSFQLPDSVDTDRIESSVKHGVLSVHLPKQNAAGSVKIPVRS